jgi:AAA+ superfamily predicted ATPase
VIARRSEPDALLPALERLEERVRLAQALPDHAIAAPPPPPEPPLDVPVLASLARLFELEPFDLHVLVLTAAAEFDPFYAGSTVDTALGLFCSTITERMRARTRLLPAAPLVRHGLVRVGGPSASAPGAELEIDPRVLALLLGTASLDERLAPWCRAIAAPQQALDRLPIDPGVARTLRALHRGAAPVAVCLHGRPGAGAAEAAEALAAEDGAPLLEADLGRVTELAAAAGLLAREARIQGAVVVVRGADQLRGEPGAVEALVDSARAVVLEATGPLHLPGVVDLTLPVPPLDARRACWTAGLGAELPDAALDALASRFHLGAGAIEAACAAALCAAAAAGRAVTLGDAMAAARAGRGDELARLTRRIEPRFGWEDIVLPGDALDQLRELCDRVRARDRVLHTWGFAPRLGSGTGATALFAGPSGTGKTMAAEVIARELGLELFAIDLSSVVSKYIGETEKNLDRIFSAARDLDAILFFDEADALFGKRSEVRDSHDRYANVEISYLLQRMETHPGVAILATNLSQNLDTAFVRRLAFTVHFPFPEEADRRDIWARAFPDALPVDDDVDRHSLAREHRLTGGNIKNVALAAAYLAAADGGRVTAAHLEHAVRRELQKLGKGPPPVAIAVDPDEALV